MFEHRSTANYYHYTLFEHFQINYSWHTHWKLCYFEQYIWCLVLSMIQPIQPQQQSVSTLHTVHNPKKKKKFNQFSIDHSNEIFKTGFRLFWIELHIFENCVYRPKLIRNCGVQMIYRNDKLFFVRTNDYLIIRMVIAQNDFLWIFAVPTHHSPFSVSCCTAVHVFKMNVAKKNFSANFSKNHETIFILSHWNGPFWAPVTFRFTNTNDDYTHSLYPISIHTIFNHFPFR